MTVTLLPKGDQWSRMKNWGFIGIVVLGFYGILLVLQHMESIRALSYNQARATMLVVATATLFLALAWATVIRAWARFITCLGIYGASALVVYHGWPAQQARAILIALTFALLIVALTLILKPKKNANHQ